MNESQPPTESLNKEVEDWVNSARQMIRLDSIEKGLVYNYDFTRDVPIRNAYSRLIWETSPLLSPKSLHIRSSSVSQNRGSSLSTAVAIDYEIPELNLPSNIPDINEISYDPPIEQRITVPFCHRRRMGSGQFNNFIFKSFSRSKSF